MNRTRTEQILESNKKITKDAAENITAAEGDVELVVVSIEAAKLGVLEDISLTLALIADCMCNMIKEEEQ